MHQRMAAAVLQPPLLLEPISTADNCVRWTDRRLQISIIRTSHEGKITPPACGGAGPVSAERRLLPCAIPDQRNFYR